MSKLRVVKTDKGVRLKFARPPAGEYTFTVTVQTVGIDRSTALRTVQGAIEQRLRNDGIVSATVR